MVRPYINRHIKQAPKVRQFKPQGVSSRNIQYALLPEEAFETIRLADLEGLYHEDAALEMGISRPTFTKIIAHGRKILADALINGKVLKIQKGNVSITEYPVKKVRHIE
ncbi:MAG: DUF134 domain-containing protein [bacterium]|nr:DUF134 domain-containing protein [bacterium]MBU1918772.1 DUF134 domain-containing protein [bacterium]